MWCDLSLMHSVYNRESKLKTKQQRESLASFRARKPIVHLAYFSNNPQEATDESYCEL
jgi:hypothetical protein